MASVTSLQQPSMQGAKMIAANPSLNQVLQSDPVRRLFNQPNIVIHAIPRNDSPTAFRMIRPKPSVDKKNEVNGEYQLPNKPEVSIEIINTSSKESNEEKNLLPSKNNGKSEILLVPIVRKRKACGHFEPCESLVCNVTVQQYEDDEGITPLISVNITEDEIDASVTKHCENVKCDALSIDHDHCRRTSIQLYRCDKCIMCDICGITFQSRKARLNHKKCRRKDTYQYNKATPSEIFKFRMRERELQILEAARLKRSSDYLDPVMGFNRTMEALTKNDELIIIPKMPPFQPKVSKPTFTPVNNNNNSSSNNNNNNSIKSILAYKRMQTPETNRELTSEMISNIILSCQNSINLSNRNEKNNSIPTKQIKLSDHLNGATVNIRDTPKATNQQIINVTAMPINNVNTTLGNKQQPQFIVNTGLPLNNVNLNAPQKQVTNITASPSNHVSTESLQPLNMNNFMVPNQSFVTPLKVVPIAELKSEPSLLHKTQGIPKFCVVPDTSVMSPQLIPKLKRPYQKNKTGKQDKKQPLPPPLPKLSLKTVQVLNSGKFRPLQPALSGTARNVEVKLGGALLAKKQKARKRPRKKLLKKGKFRCTYCPKRFSTVDYCKLHISKHENNPGFFCRLCDKSFLNKYIMKKHMEADHKVGEVRCEMCDCVLPSLQELSKHMKCPEVEVNQQCSECLDNFDTCSSLDVHMRKEHGFRICTLCKRQVTKSKMKRHLMLEHSISKIRSETGFEKLTYLPSENDKVCEVDLSEITTKEETIVKTETVSENKVKVDCLARNRSIRRRSSKEFFVCTVCDRRFENEKQFQIHLANNPMKFTVCPDCGKKFHRKSEYTEHSKTCNYNTVVPVAQVPKRRKSNLSNDELILKNDNDIISQNSNDQKQNKILELNNCKNLKLNEEKFIQKEDNESKSILKSTIENKIVNGLNQDSSDCLEMLKVIKSGNDVQKDEDYEVIECDDEEVLLLNAKQTQINSNESEVYDKLRVVSSIFQDHNYQAMR